MFKTGDVVTTTAHTHRMTVKEVDGTTAKCNYFIGTEAHEEDHAFEVLKLVPEKKSPFPVKVTVEVAGDDVTRWLDGKRIKPMKREIYQNKISDLIMAVMYGDLQINDDLTITHNLNFPIKDKDGKILFEKLTYTPRLSAAALDQVLNAMTSTTEMANTVAYGAALSGLPIARVWDLETTDINILAAVGVFFTT